MCHKIAKQRTKNPNPSGDQLLSTRPICVNVSIELSIEAELPYREYRNKVKQVGDYLSQAYFSSNYDL